MNTQTALSRNEYSSCNHCNKACPLRNLDNSKCNTARNIEGAIAGHMENTETAILNGWKTVFIDQLPLMYQLQTIVN